MTDYLLLLTIIKNRAEKFTENKVWTLCANDKSGKRFCFRGEGGRDFDVWLFIYYHDKVLDWRKNYRNETDCERL